MNNIFNLYDIFGFPSKIILSFQWYFLNGSIHLVKYFLLITDITFDNYHICQILLKDEEELYKKDISLWGLKLRI